MNDKEKLELATELLDIFADWAEAELKPQADKKQDSKFKTGYMSSKVEC